MGGILSFILKSFMSFGFGKIMEWWNRRQAEAAKRRAEQLEAYMVGKDAAEKESAEYVEADRKLKAEQDKIKTYDEKLKKLQEFNSKSTVEG